MSNAKAARRARFEGVFTLIRDELITYCQNEGMPPEAVKWYGKSLDYNVPGGKLNRGMSVVDTVEILKGRPLTEEEYVKAAVLGWCIELLQAYFLVSDDMMDSSITRRGQPCWYLTPSPALTTPSSTPTIPSTVPASLGNAALQANQKHPLVGMVAINDSFMISSAIFHLIKTHFRGQTCYMDLVEIFHDITFKTEMGQLVDLVTAPEGVVDLARFSMERHHMIVIYKTAYYSFHLPVAIAMHMCNIPTTYRVRLASNETKIIKPYDLTLAILLPLGEYFQIQDDFLDFSATPEVLGKIGTDIVDNKCSWCINKALELCTPEQRLILDRNYGRKGDIEAGAVGDGDDKRAEGSTEAGGACEQRVKEVYEALNLRQVYADYEANVYRSLNEMIDGIPEDGVIVDEQGNKVEEHNGLKRQVFRSFLDKIYGRSK